MLRERDLGSGYGVGGPEGVRQGEVLFADHHCLHHSDDQREIVRGRGVTNLATSAFTTPANTHGPLATTTTTPIPTTSSNFYQGLSLDWAWQSLSHSLSFSHPVFVWPLISVSIRTPNWKTMVPTSETLIWNPLIELEALCFRQKKVLQFFAQSYKKKSFPQSVLLQFLPRISVFCCCLDRYFCSLL